MKIPKNFSLFFVSCTFLISTSLFSIEKGSETTMSIESHAIFPNTDSDNKMLAFGWFKNGFTLEDNFTSCTFESVFPVSGGIAINGGTLHLNTDLRFDHLTSLTSLGTIYGNSHILELPKISIIQTTTQYDYVFDNINLSIYSDITLSGTIVFKGTNILDGHSNNIYLNPNTNIIIDFNSTLLIKDIIIQDISDENIRCSGDTACLILQNVAWIQDGNFVFNHGAFQIQDKVKIVGEDKKFVYATSCTSTINKHSTLILDRNFTFSYDPNSTNSNLLEFEDSTATMELRSATLHTTETGLHLTKGSLYIKKNSYLSCDGEITFGNNLEAEDLKCEISGESQLHVVGGPLAYKNTQSSCWNMINQNSILNIHNGACLELYQTLNVEPGAAYLHEGAGLFKDSGKYLLGTTSIYE